MLLLCHMIWLSLLDLERTLAAMPSLYDASVNKRPVAEAFWHMTTHHAEDKGNSENGCRQVWTQMD